MSLAEIKETIADMSPEQRLEIAALIAHLNRTDDPQAELDGRLSAMEAGRKNSAATFETRHEELNRRGK